MDQDGTYFESPQEPNEPVEQIELTDDHYKAAMDRCWIASEFIGSTVIDHPVIAQTPVWKAMATFAQDIMVSLYTELGTTWNTEPK